MTQPFDTFSIDHFVPLARGGTHQLPNLLPCCVRCNGAKRDRTPEEWLEVRDRLYIVDVAIAYYRAVLRYADDGLVTHEGDPLWLSTGLINITKNGPKRKEVNNRTPHPRKERKVGYPDIGNAEAWKDKGR
jgi:5-methylcytosine-specific restriction endonuclease McrA